MEQDGKQRTVIRLYVSMQDLSAFFFAVCTQTCNPGTNAARSAMSVWMVAMMKSEQNLHKVVPDGVFGYHATLFLCLFDDPREIPAAAIFHEDVEDARISVDEAIVVTNDVVVVKVFENVTRNLNSVVRI